MPAEKDYTKYSFLVTILVVVMMLGLSFIPPFNIGSVRFKRTNILSDILKIGNDSLKVNYFDDSSDHLFLEEMERREAEQQRIADSIAALKLKPAKPQEQSWNIDGDAAGKKPLEAQLLTANGDRVTGIEDFTSAGGNSIADFCRLLGTDTKKRPVRIAFLGDSFIEGDILTADVREQLQTLYGGKGVGFVPFSTPLASYRPTVKHTFGGWTTYNVVKKKTVPEEYADKFFVSGMISVPDTAGAWVQYECTGYRKNVSQCQSVRIIFESSGSSRLNVTVNDSIDRSFVPEPSDLVQQIKVDGSTIKKVRVDVDEPEGFIGYGVVFESGTGIVVDNYALRSNSGVALFGTSASVNSQIGRMLDYDLVVLQYGLNAMAPDVMNYTGYRQNMVRVVNYMKRSFPGAAILVMSVGDRSTMESGEFITMPSVESMVKEQRNVARECNVAFWNTYMGMGGRNSMPGFVEKEWAAKDYTHLSFGGGRYIAKQLVNALEYAKQHPESTVPVSNENE